VRTHVGAHPGDHVQLTVADTGMGMTDDVKQRIFEPFFTTKGMGKGTGLGLATVYGIIKQSGGYIAVDSSPGSGTTFTILLPREVSRFDRIQAADLSSSSSSLVPYGSETVLLVEDEDGVRDLAQLSLTSCGYQVLSAKSGEAALSLASQHPERVHLLF